jgi:hypothetical protein
MFEAVGSGNLEEAARLMIDGSGGDGYLARQGSAYQTIIRDNLPSITGLMAQDPPPRITCEDLAALRVPTSIVQGSLTRPVFAVPSKAASECIGNGRHITVAGVSHLWPQEDPHGFVAMVEEIDHPA